MRDKRLTKAALKYHGEGYSVIPVNPKTKRPAIKTWKQYQDAPADPAQLRKWFNDQGKPGLAIVTGRVSGITAVDIDSPRGRDAVSEFIPDSLETPHAKTPHGEHLFFKYEPGIENKVRIIIDCDVRNDGGYVVAAPSRNGSKSYAWFDGLKPTDVKPAPMPGMLKDILRGTNPANSSSQYINKVKTNALINTNVFTRGDNIKPVTTNRQQVTTSDNIAFTEGYRDNALFHLANCCIKGGMDSVNI